MNARIYQESILQEARKRNTIVFLPTGCGKTYISIMLMKDMAEQCFRRNHMDRKYVVFLANTVQLVNQHFKTLRAHIPFETCCLTGDKNVDTWTQIEWNHVVDNNDVLVMTPQVYLNALYCGYIHLHDTCLIVFDECHHAGKNHPMKKILDEYSKVVDMNKPHILGLTATLLMSFKFPENTLKLKIQEVKTLFGAEIETSTDADVFRYSTNPLELLAIFEDNEGNGNMCSNLSVEKYIKGLVRMNDLEKKYVDMLKRSYKSVLRIQSTLGPCALKLACDLCIQKTWKYREIYVDVYNEFVEKLRCLSAEATDKMFQECQYPDDIIYVITRSATKKLILLLKILKNCQRHDRTILFVRERMSARILYNILMKLVERESGPFSHLKPDFIVGGDGSPNNVASQCAENGRNIVNRFNEAKTNLLICTNLLEEGIDIQKCNLVIQFDEVESYRSYIQSKGRARDSNSRYILFVNKNSNKQKMEMESWKQTETFLSNLCEMLSKSDRSKNDDVEIKPFEETEYKTSLGKATLISANFHIERYCSSFVRRYGQELATPYWYRIQDLNRGFRCKLLLPDASPVKDEIIGPWCSSTAQAKRSTAFEALKLLHSLGQLDDRLLPVKFDEQILIKEEQLYPYWEDDDKDAENNLKITGTKKKLRKIPKSVSEYLCNNKPVSYAYTHLYEIHFDSLQKLPDFSNINSEKTVGFITAREVPLVDNFHIHSNYGSYKIRMELVDKCLFSECHIKKLRTFHTNLFMDYLKIVPNFLAYDENDRQEDNISLFVVPLMKKLGKSTIDWDLMTKAFNYNDVEDTSSFINGQLVRPTYITDHKTVYIVTNNESNKNANSRFSNKNYSTYSDYYEQKWNVVLKLIDRPFIGAKHFKIRSEFLLPSVKKMKKKIENDEEKYRNEVYLPPEVLKVFSVTWDMCLKFHAVPTILHRLNHLLMVYSFGERICSDLKLTKPSITDFKPEEEKIDHQLEERKIDEELEDGELEDGELEELDTKKEVEKQLLDENATLIKEKKPGLFDHLSPVPLLPVLFECTNTFVAPTAGELLQAFTAVSSDDILNYERLETLGDSFLKFAVTLSLFINREEYDPGKLSLIKDRLLGNRNLFYVGSHIKVGSIVKVRKFDYQTTWCPPCFKIPTFIEELISEYNLSSTFLSECAVPILEQKLGEFSETTISSIKNKASCSENKFNITDEYNISKYSCYLKYDIINDKTIADVVEALIGLYLNKCGVHKAYELLQYLNVLVPTQFSYDGMLNARLCNITVMKDDSLFAEYEKVQETIGYVFTDKNLLLQAFLHPSHPLIAGSMFNSYERLEFLGDAIIDFLITSYIYHHYDNLSPGKLSDLRSALVNNATFACLVIRFGLHKNIKYNNANLFLSMSKFINIQEKNEHSARNAVTFIDKQEGIVIRSCSIPKILGDVFESLAAAIYLDSNKNLEIVWTVFYNLMKSVIDEFSKNIPINPVRRLSELNINFNMRKIENKNIASGIIIAVTVKRDNGNQEYYYGYSKNKNDAKKAAASAVLGGKPYRCNTNAQEEYVDDVDEIENYIISIYPELMTMNESVNEHDTAFLNKHETTGDDSIYKLDFNFDELEKFK